MPFIDLCLLTPGTTRDTRRSGETRGTWSRAERRTGAPRRTRRAGSTRTTGIRASLPGKKPKSKLELGILFTIHSQEKFGADQCHRKKNNGREMGGKRPKSH